MTSARLPGRRRGRRVRAAIVGIGLAAAVAVTCLAVANRGTRGALPVVASERAAASDPAAPTLRAGFGSSMSSAAAGSAASGEPDTPAGADAATPESASGGASGAPPEPVGTLAGPVAKRPGEAGVPSKSGGGKLPVRVAPGVAGNGAAGSGSAAGPGRPGSDAPWSPDGTLVSGKKLKSSKPRLDRTSLSGDDIERAMTAVAGTARACAGGARGTASLRLTVAPSGRIAQVTASGPFAGTPVGACVERAVRSATFPPWDGAPQSFDYSYLLSD
jgi:hypothetical protein